MNLLNLFKKKNNQEIIGKMTAFSTQALSSALTKTASNPSIPTAQLV
ncbi:MAG: hypothetical protein R3A50_11120 [Saprospiraceae bacterium]